MAQTRKSASRHTCIVNTDLGKSLQRISVWLPCKLLWLYATAREGLNDDEKGLHSPKAAELICQRSLRRLCLRFKPFRVCRHLAKLCHVLIQVRL